MQPACQELPDQFINWELVPYFIQDGAVLYNSYLSSSIIQGMGKILKLSRIIFQKFCFINIVGLTVKIQINLITEN